MHENVKEKGATREPLTKERREKEMQVLWRGRLRRLSREVVFCLIGGLLGQAELMFGTQPLGVAVLCAAGKHTPAVFLGLILSTLLQMEYAAVYICVYAAAALARIAVLLVLDTPDARIELPRALRMRLEAARKEDEEEADNTTEEGTASEADLFEERSKRSKRQAFKSAKWHALREATLDIFSESVCLRMAIAAICAFLLSLYRLIVGGFQYYDLFGTVFVLILTPLAVAIYSVCMGTHVRHMVPVRISEATLLASVIFASASLFWGALSIGVTLAVFCTLYACSTRGAIEGVVAALLCGVATSPLYAPAYLAAALVYLFCKSLGKERAGVLLTCPAFLIWGLYLEGAIALWRLLPAYLVAGVVISLLLRLRADETKREEEPEPAEQTETRLRLENDRYRDGNDRFRGISDAFSSLSEVFYNLSDRFRRPGTLDLRRICDGAFDRHCTDCPNKTVCWGLEYGETLNTVNSLIARLHTRGKVTEEQVPDALLHRCEWIESILGDINSDCAKLTGELLRNNRTEIFAMDYESAASIINDALEEDDGEYRFDHELEQRLCEYLADAGVRTHGVTVYGNRRRRIVVRGVDLEEATVTVETLRADIGELCGMDLGRPVFEVEGNLSTMTLQARKRISVSGAKNNISADGGVSGDSVNLFSNKKDYFYALISDGMGAGKEAAMTSGLCSVFLEKMLRAGNRASTSLRMLNNMIRSRGADSTRECSSTVDLMELDLMTAEAAFIKSGAAPSFVVRERIVHRLQAGTAPIGIIRVLDMQSTPFQLKPGDTVVMISDGILPDEESCNRLVSYLTEAASYTPEEIVYHICLQAAEREEHDDCSAIALRIEAAES